MISDISPILKKWANKKGCGAMTDKVMDRCGLFGMYNNDHFDTARVIYYGLFSLQHRGVEAAGICVHDKGRFNYKKDKGLVTDVFNELELEHMGGHMGIGHVLRYAGQDAVENAQPIVIRYTNGHMAVALNGGLTNTEALRTELEQKGAVFQTLEAAEVISVLISRARNKFPTIEEAIADVLPKLKGGYALLVMTPRKVIGVRDPLGIRPLMLGRKGNSSFFASETCAFNELDVEFVREIEPGEIAVAAENGIHSLHVRQKGCALCAFEYIYHSRPDSVFSGLEIYKARAKMGQVMASQAPADVDAVVWVPDSGLAAASGYAQALGAPLVDAFVKNKYFGSRLIQPDEAMFNRGINMKLSVIQSRVKGLRVAVVDDSMIRGTTAKIFVAALKNAGAKEVHLRVCAPVVRYNCMYGASAPNRQLMDAPDMTEAQIQSVVGADSVRFLSIDGMKEALCESGQELCLACFNGIYPVQ